MFKWIKRLGWAENKIEFLDKHRRDLWANLHNKRMQIEALERTVKDMEERLKNTP